jgi:hypothetical protein
MPGNRNHGRGGPPRGGRGGANVGRGGARGGARGGNSGAGGGGGKVNVRIAKPAIHELPESLLLSTAPTEMPTAIRDAMNEFKKPQAYFSALEKLQPSLEASIVGFQSCWLGISGENVTGIERQSESSFEGAIKMSDGTTRDIFIKRIHLVDPLAAMEGEYVLPGDGALAAPSNLWKNTLMKINNPLNEAYVDCLFALYASKFVESRISPHWCRCYGTFSARVDTYVYNISEEYDSLRKKSWWNVHQRLGLFKYQMGNEGKKPLDALFTQPGEALSLYDFVSVDADTGFVSTINDITVSEEEPVVNNEEPVKLTNPKLRLKRLSDSSGSGDSGSGSGSDSDSYESDEVEEFVEFHNFPVQVSLLEKADGTMDTLLDEEDADDAAMLETKDVRWAAWLFQVIAGLVVGQHYFGFVHNDLHTNNIMWKGTGVTDIYYRVVKGKETWYMKIPTYGRLMKIIDFGRASFTVPGAGFFISDAFFPGNDAATQYNCEPFFDSAEGKKVEPNTSFDLCRLAVSLLESLFPDRPANSTPVKIISREGAKLYPETVSPVYNLLWEWLTDDNGKNVLRTPAGEERYPDFDLYRALAAEVHNAMPKVQVEKALFSQFRCTAKDIPADTQVYELILAP